MYPISCCPRGHTGPTNLKLVSEGRIQKCVLCGAEMTPVTGSLDIPAEAFGDFYPDQSNTGESEAAQLHVQRYDGRTDIP